jgi:hypothetical protein
MFFHELLSPIIEVAGDAQTAKAQWDAIGGEVFKKADGTKATVWDVDRYHVDFIKEDGNWVIYNLDWHPVFMTPFDSPGWGAKPTVSMGEFFSGIDAKLAPKPVRDGCTKVPYRRLATDNNKLTLSSSFRHYLSHIRHGIFLRIHGKSIAVHVHRQYYEGHGAVMTRQEAREIFNSPSNHSNTIGILYNTLK